MGYCGNFNADPDDEPPTKSAKQGTAGEDLGLEPVPADQDLFKLLVDGAESPSSGAMKTLGAGRHASSGSTGGGKRSGGGGRGGGKRGGSMVEVLEGARCKGKIRKL